LNSLAGDGGFPNRLGKRRIAVRWGKKGLHAEATTKKRQSGTEKDPKGGGEIRTGNKLAWGYRNRLG